MKALCSLLLLFLFATCASAQARSNSPDTPRVTVIQKKWRVDIRNPKLDEDQFNAMAEREQAERDRKENIRINEVRSQQGMPPQDAPVRQLSRERKARGLSVTYIYEVKVRNIGEKAIRALTWEYVFLEPGTAQEVNRRRFVSEVNIGPGKTRNLVMRSTSSPTGTVDAAKADKKFRNQYSEEIVIQSIEYADGSVWQLRNR